ncbi:MAG TPA: alpha/beta hydrolase [Candidatus Sulfotelmatobacter sp.]
MASNIGEEFRIEWQKDPFLLLTANQPTGLLLAILVRLRPKWVIIERIQDRERYFYVYRTTELQRLLSSASMESPVTNALGLHEFQSSLQVLSTRRPGFATRRDEAIPATNRVVALNAQGRVSSFGQITKRGRKTTEQKGPTRFVQETVRRGPHEWYTAEASGAFERGGQRRIIKARKAGRGMVKYKASKKKASRWRASRRPGLPASSHRREYEIVRIFYATDRLLKREAKGQCVYGNDRAKDEVLQLGECEVSIPATHTMGELESPSIWRLEFSPDPRHHVVLLQTVRLSDQQFFAAVRARIASNNDAFVFIHGYNVSFEDAARRTAQIAYDLQFRGAPILYSWPSRASLAKYPADEATIDWTRPHLKQFLGDLVARSGARVIHVIAHSMGNRALMRALTDLGKLPTGGARLHQVVLTAPDIDAGEFVQLANQINPNAERVTLYASSRDEAIKASRRFHDYARAGEAGRNIIVMDGVDTIDASSVDTSLLAHSYFGSKRTVLSDLSYLLRDGYPPDRRHGLEPKEHPKGRYWAFRR